ncbi:SDR family oxidoreductase [Lacinutrix sp. 5H-3-7-4]|uniref:SDR family oxidoreductase n=1 Tax=Lacinutrix sp. (strain 5H-3-7-4) TaxID=983544 RepID=UPI00020A38A3|nr:SDR family oxidoreductase [Lacinutrix sp. 5H-3-7-4]AEH00880.1 UDP-glucose 4-epimerase [Lacinutrix sp. 5H-3-7-4]
MTKYHTKNLSDFTFLVTGGAGFIGSNIVDYLLKNDAKRVVILDNFSTGHHKNINNLIKDSRCELIEGDIRDLETCKKSTIDVDYVLHQAALGSVPRSINDPLTSNEVNVSGFLNMLIAAKESKSVKRMVYAASSSTYGDSEGLPKVEDVIGKPLSPYAVTKYVNELYADVFYKTYGLETIGLRYFNVFGPKQDPEGAYAAVIPKFVGQFLNKENIVINGDGEHSRDFTFIENVIQANIKAALAEKPEAVNQVYNVAFGENTNLNELVDDIKSGLKNLNVDYSATIVKHGPDRVGDVKHSLADITKAKKLIDYNPLYSFKEGIKITTEWYYNEL